MYTLYKLDFIGNNLMRSLLDSTACEVYELTDFTLKAENKIIDISDEVLDRMHASGEIYRFIKQLLPDLKDISPEKLRVRYGGWLNNTSVNDDDLYIQVSALWYMDEINYAVFHHTDDE